MSKADDISELFDKVVKEKYVSKDVIKEKLEEQISFCRCEELEDTGGHDVHKQYWSMFRQLLCRIERKLLEEE